MAQTSIENNSNLYFSQIWNGDTFWNFTHSFGCERFGVSDKIIELIILLILILINTFIKI